MIRVLLADDEPLIRAGVRAVLATDPGIEVVAEAADGQRAVELARAHRPDVVLLDIRMPVLDGLTAAERIQGPGIAVLTTFGEDENIARALAAGASGFLLKGGDPRDLIAGVRAVAEGAAFLSPPVARRVIARLDPARVTRAARARELVAALTPRERDVLAGVAAGKPNRRIAGDLRLVESTVKAHVSAILTRLDAENRVQAALIAYEAGLV
ncbi:response regulator [Actinokineospora sp. G85]|uniref:response regulator n=1 Tax=Actinokineospora sp. G85 TaxID=3406626 RepID=UPI003C709EEE